MKAIEVTDTKLSVASKDIPPVKDDEVLIKVHAAGVNRADVLQRRGLYPPPPGASDILGLEVSGQVEHLGKEVTQFQINDDVCALLEGGGYAEYVAVPASQVLPVPDGLDYVQAAALPEAFFTVWHHVFMVGGLEKGESLLVHGGTSGIGTSLLQLAKAKDVICFATAKSAEKCAVLETLGVKKAVSYTDQDFEYAVREATAQKGVDMVLDMVGGEYFQKNLNVLAHGGRLVCIGFVGGAKAQVNFAPLLKKNLAIIGATLRDKSKSQKAVIALGVREHVWPLLENKKVTPIIDSVFWLDDAQKAHDLMESNCHIGKIILRCRE